MATLSSVTSKLRNMMFPTTVEGTSSGAELATTDGRTLALSGTRLTGEAVGGIARLVLEQRFENRYTDILNVVYRMPLPADGAVSGYEFVIGERTIKGQVDKKRRARERFDQAILEGKTAALLEQERADIFTQQLGNIPPGETIVARITVDQKLVWLPEGEWELRFPTVIGPRYVSQLDTPADAKATHVKVSAQPLGELFGVDITVRDKILGGAKPSSPTHELGKPARLDRDFVLRWRVATQEPGLSLAAAARDGGDAYGLLTIVPPARAAKATPVSRDVLFLIDTSGSMGGAPLTTAKQVLGLVIGTLGPSDRLEMIEFSIQPRRWQPEPVTCDDKMKAAALAWVDKLTADGGTEMRTAVIESLKSLRIGAQRQVVLVTDGYVGGEQQILEELHRKLPASCRMHFVGVGSACNRSLATAIARAGRGAEIVVGPDEDVERGALRLLKRTALPMLTNVEISGSALQRHAPEKLPDVFEGAPLVAALALDPNGGELVVRGRVAGDEWQQVIVVPAQAPGQGNQAIPALYGRERVADVEAHAMFDSRDGEIEELGMTYQIATKMTSWIAVDDSRTVKGQTRDEIIPQEVPYGTSMAQFGLRGSMPAMPGAGAPLLGMAPPAPAAPMARGGAFAGPPRGPMAPPPARRDADEFSDWGEESEARPRRAAEATAKSAAPAADQPAALARDRSAAPAADKPAAPATDESALDVRVQAPLRETAKTSMAPGAEAALKQQEARIVKRRRGLALLAALIMAAIILVIWALLR